MIPVMIPNISIKNNVLFTVFTSLCELYGIELTLSTFQTLNTHKRNKTTETSPCHIFENIISINEMPKDNPKEVENIR